MTPLSDELLLETLRIWKAYGSVERAAKSLNLQRTTFQTRLRKAQFKFPDHYNEDDVNRHFIRDKNGWTYQDHHIPTEEIKTVLIGGDAHIWPGEPSLMWKAFCKVAKKYKPDAIVLNGDIIDGARVSRHGRFLGSRAPKIMDEIEAVYEHLKMLPKAKTRIWTVGNHDIRVDNYLANQAPELEDYLGSFVDRFPEWKFCYAATINNVEIRHRFRGGIHAAWNNALHSGVTMVTSHSHQLQMTAIRNRNGSHYGIEAGMLGDPNSPAFEYSEAAPSRACPGFVFLSFDEDGNIMPPELCEMIRGRPAFRGQYVY